MTAREIAEPNTILRCEAGSSIFGLNLDDASDRDELGVCIEPPEYVVGLRHFEQWVYRDQPDGYRSGDGDLDLTVYGLRKWTTLALKGNPTVLLLLFVPPGRCTVWTRQAAELQAMSWAFASKKAAAAFLGYMQQQRARLQGERGQTRVKRPELIDRHGFDTKYAGHILRLGYQGIEFLATGRISVPTPEEARAKILACRRGEMDENEALTLAGELEAELKASIDSSPLPDEPAYDAVNDWLVRQYTRWWVAAR
jgi:hypothetical protein